MRFKFPDILTWIVGALAGLALGSATGSAQAQEASIPVLDHGRIIVRDFEFWREGQRTPGGRTYDFIRWKVELENETQFDLYVHVTTELLDGDGFVRECQRKDWRRVKAGKSKSVGGATTDKGEIADMKVYVGWSRYKPKPSLGQILAAAVLTYSFATSGLDREIVTVHTLAEAATRGPSC